MKCDESTFISMYETVYKDLYRFALCMMRHPQDAEDAVSEAVILAYENIQKLRKEDAFKSWILKILSNICKKKLKGPERQDAPLEKQDEFVQTDFSMRIDLQKAFFILSEEERMIVALSVFGGYNSVEIGKMHHLNPNTVRSKRSRALSKMGCMLEQ